MEQGTSEPLTPHGVIAERVKSLRTGRGWSQERLAAEMKAVGIPWERIVVTKLENGKRAGVSVEEMFALAHVLDVAPVHLLVPPLGADESNRTPYRIVPSGEPTAPVSAVRAWIRGQAAGGSDPRRYFTEVPDEEWTPPAWEGDLFRLAGPESDDAGR